MACGPARKWILPDLVLFLEAYSAASRWCLVETELPGSQEMTLVPTRIQGNGLSQVSRQLL